MEFAHPLPLDSLRHVRAKIHGQRLDAAALSAVVNDIAAGRYLGHLPRVVSSPPAAMNGSTGQEMIDPDPRHGGERRPAPTGAAPLSWTSTAWAGCRATGPR